MTSSFGRLLRGLAFAATAFALLPLQSAHAAGNYTQTRYPIVLVHGMFGFDSALGVDYFYGIPGALRRDGAKVYVAQVSAINTTEVRGEQLLAQVKNILALSGASKVNLIGHSHGGPTSRYVAGVAPQLVASVTNIAGPTFGTRVADVALNELPPGSVGGAVANSVILGVGSLINLLSGGANLPEQPLAGLASITTKSAAKFNQRFSAGVPTSSCGNGAELVNGVRYYSWTGTKLLTNALDLSDVLLATVGTLVFNGAPNDGLVDACSTRLGKHLGDYRQNHLDEINQIAGLRDWLSADPVTLYRQHANRLKTAGL